MSRNLRLAPRLRFAPLFVVAAIASLAAGTVAAGESPRVLAEGASLPDRRLEPPKDLNGFFPFRPPEDVAAWESRAASLRRRILVATGLWPLPERTPLEAVVHGRVERDGFTVEKVYFQSYPGHYVTGLLFRPSEPGRALRPGVLCPHGHGGRQMDLGAQVEGLIAAGQEKFERSGRFPKLARCAQLARMGCVSFIYDMLGYADSQQISYELAHRFSKQRDELDTPERWGFYSTQAELRLQSIFGLQTWNSIRALDFLASLPDVDATRLGVTGGSGGGTQTILLCAIDPRPVVAFPQGMVSTSMQGGCTCENCSLLRVGSGNVELAGLFAPRPQAMTAANDWTKAMMEEGYPYLRQLYALYDEEENVRCEPFLEFPHNYNYVTRQRMYDWFDRHLGLGHARPVEEIDWEPLSAAESAVWNEDHPAPEGGVAYEVKLTRQLDEMSRRALERARPKDATSLAAFRALVGGALEAIVGRDLPAASAIERRRGEKVDRDDHLEFTDVIVLEERGEAVPVVSLWPKSGFEGDVVLWLHGDGKDGLWTDDGPRPEVRALLASGRAVLTIDAHGQGEALADGRSSASNPLVSNPREFAGYTYCYNDTVLARRVHDVLTMVAWIRGADETRSLELIATDGAAPWGALAAALVGERIDRARIDTRGFRFAALESYVDADFLPGAVKYGDLPALLALRAPGALVLAGEGESGAPDVVRAAYAAAGREAALRTVASREALLSVAR